MKRRTLWQRIIIYGAALLLAVFWFGPFVLVGLGSVIPEANLFSFPPNWFADPPFLGNYKIHIYWRDSSNLPPDRHDAQHGL